MADGSYDNVKGHVYAETLRQPPQEQQMLIGELPILKLLKDSIKTGIGFDEICRRLVRFVTETMNIENASIMVFDSERKELRHLVGTSFDEDDASPHDDIPQKGRIFKIGEGIAGQVARDRKSILINEIQGDPRFVPAKDQKVEVHSILCLPLVHEDRLHGVLNLSSSRPNMFTSKKEHALSIIASTASVALSRAVAVDRLKQANTELALRNRELAAVNALSELLHSSLDLDSVLSEALNNIFDGFDIAGAAVFLRDGESDPMTMRASSVRAHDSTVKQLLQSAGERHGPTILRTRGNGFDSDSAERFPLDGEDSSSGRECIGVPLMSGEDCIGMLVVISGDVSALGKTELKLLSSLCKQIGVAVQNSILVQRLRDNIEELEEKRHTLIQSDKLALLGEMVSGVALEINNPLAAIMGYSELLIDAEEVSDNGKAMLERTISCVDRCRKIVQSLLSFARKTDLEKRPLNMAELIDNVLFHKELDLAANNIEVVKAYEIEAPTAVVDPIQMEQVFLNLVNNAFDSMVGRDVPGILEIRICEADDDTMQLEFIDNGRGIKESDKTKLFEPFFTTKEVGKGTGLGLSVSYGIVKEHGGDLYLDDAHYCGAKFILTLPMTSDRAVAEEPGRPEESADWPKTHGKVLVVDDEDVVSDVIDAALSVKGFSVECAATGEEAYHMIGSGEYDLIISDIRMPGAMDGRRLYYKVKEQNPALAMRFVFISGDVMEKNTAEFLNECGRAYLLKPFSLTDLRAVIERTLHPSRL